MEFIECLNEDTYVEEKNTVCILKVQMFRPLLVPNIIKYKFYVSKDDHIKTITKEY